MNPDRILSHLRELSAQAMPSDNQPAPCDCDSAEHSDRHRLELMAAHFIALDSSLSRGGTFPAGWAVPQIPAQRTER